MRPLAAFFLLLATLLQSSRAGHITDTSTRYHYDATAFEGDSNYFDEGHPVDGAIGKGDFPKGATVQVEHQSQPVSLKDLKIGDRVWTANHQYAPIYAFGAARQDQYDIFVRLDTKKGTLQLTGEHLIYLNGQSNPVRIDSIQPGDVLQGGTKVMSTSRMVQQGVYVPLTTAGTIMVNGFAVSNYLSYSTMDDESSRFLLPHQFLHMGLSPLRMACLGASPRFCSHDNPQGRPMYLSGLLWVQDFLENRSKSWIQCALYFCYWLIMGFCRILEGMFGASEAPSALAVLALIYSLGRALRLQVRVKIIYPQR